MPLPTPTKKHNCCWDWGEGVAGFNLVQKKSARDAIIMWTMSMMMTMTLAGARGGSKGRSINGSILLLEGNLPKPSNPFL